MPNPKKIKIIGIIFGVFALLSLISSIPIREMLIAYYSDGYTTDKTSEGVGILSVFENSPAEKAGLQVGDVLTRVGALPVDSTSKFVDLTSRNKGKEITVTANRNGEVLEVQLVPRLNPPVNQGATGLVIGQEFETVDQNTIERLKTAVIKSYSGYAVIPESISPLGGSIYLFLSTSNYITYEYTGNFEYIFQALYATLLIFLTIGILKRKKWAIILAFIQGFINAGLLINSLFIYLTTFNHLNLPIYTYIYIAFAIGLNIFFIYLAFYLYKHRNLFNGA